MSPGALPEASPVDPVATPLEDPLCVDVPEPAVAAPLIAWAPEFAATPLVALPDAPLVPVADPDALWLAEGDVEEPPHAASEAMQSRTRFVVRIEVFWRMRAYAANA